MSMPFGYPPSKMEQLPKTVYEAKFEYKGALIECAMLDNGLTIIESESFNKLEELAETPEQIKAFMERILNPNAPEWKAVKGRLH